MKTVFIRIPDQTVAIFEGALDRSLARQIKENHLFWISGEQTDRWFCRSVKDGTFRRNPLLPGRNFFTPALEGSYLQNGTDVHMELRIRGALGLTIALWVFALCAVLNVFGAFRILTQAQSFGPEHILLLVAFPVLFLVFFLLGRYFEKTYIRRFFSDLRSTFRNAEIHTP